MRCPPADWPVERKRKYFDWAAAVIDQLRGVCPGLKNLCEILNLYGQWPLTKFRRLRKKSRGPWGSGVVLCLHLEAVHPRRELHPVVERLGRPLQRCSLP